MKPAYYVKGNGTIVMDYEIFKSLSPDKVVNLLSRSKFPAWSPRTKANREPVSKKLQLAFSL